MNKALLATAACAALGLAAAAQAAIVPSLTVVNANGTLTGMPGWAGYKLTLTSDQGVISAIDFGGVDAADPQQANKGIFGRVSQRTVIDADAGTTAPTPVGNANTISATARDSLWHNGWARTGVIYGETEDNDGVNGAAGNPLADTATSDWGIGHAMHFATGVQAAAQSSILDVAYLVLQQGSAGPYVVSSVAVNPATDIHVVGEVQAGAGGKTPMNFFLAQVPEPASMGILGLGLVGLVARRRRA